MSALRLAAVAAVCAVSAGASPGHPDLASFREVYDRLFQEPLAQLPERRFPELRIGLALLNGKLPFRLDRTLEQPADFKEAAPKLVHGLGVCAAGEWRIHAASPATGLLAPGTVVPAIIRISSGSNRTRAQPPVPRNFGFAIKLFPTSDPDERVFSRNLVVFDQFGMDGDVRRSFFRPRRNGEPLVFSNLAAARLPHSLVATALLHLFEREPMIRPLLPFTEVDGHGAAVAQPHTPRILQLIPRGAQLPDGPSPVDYRQELLDYPPGTLVFDIVLPAQEQVPRSVVLGTLSVGKMQVTRTCDESLHFYHHPWPDEPGR